MSWRLGLSSGACTDRPIREIIPALRQAGAGGIEVSTPPRHFDPWQHDQVVSLADLLQASSLEAVSIHAPFGGAFDLADPNPHHRHTAIGGILTAAGAIKHLGGRVVVAHPSDIPRQPHDVEARLADSARSLRLLLENLRPLDVTLAVESPLPHLVGGHPDEFEWLLRQLGDGVGICLDTGHTSLGGHWRRFVELSDGRLIHVHANDNNGHWDDHLPPGDGAIDWGEIQRTLRAVDFEGWVMLELACPAGDPPAYFTRALERARELLASA